MTEVRQPVRVLQSGKVYRQIFDAEVQLMKSLGASKSKPQIDEKVYLPDLSKKSANISQPDFTIASNPPACNILSARQKTWATRMPNDSVTENPVLHRQVTADLALKLKQKESNSEVTEVCGLPNIVRSSRSGSNIIERIAEKRKLRHDKLLDEMYHDLSKISHRIEPRIIAIGESLRQQLEEDDATIDNIFKQIANDEDLVNFSYEQLEEIWSSAESHSSSRQEWIESSNEKYNQVEDERLEAISGVLKTYTIKLDKVASLPSADIHRLIEKEAMMINQSILANRRAYAKLNTNFLESDIEREVSQQRTWSERVKDWKKLNAELAVKQFRDFMKSENVLNPPAIKQTLDTLLQEQKQLGDVRFKILEQLRDLKPPSSTKPIVYKWNTALTKAYENIDRLHSKLLQSLHEKYEATCQMCLAEIEKYKQNLLISKVCDEDDMRRIVNDHLLPLVGNQLKAFEQKLEEMDKNLEDQAITTEKHMKTLFKFAQGAAHLWDVHEIGLAKQERQLHDKMEETRQAHDSDNQERETKLDVALDRLRQESTEEALVGSLQQCIEQLTNIKQGYQDFHQAEIQTVMQYPGMVKLELRRYEDTICKYFNIDRTNSINEESSTRRLSAYDEQQKSSKMKLRRQSVQLEENPSWQRRRSIRTSGDTSRGSSRQLLRSSEQKMEDDDVDQVVREVLTTSRGTTFFILTKTDHSDEENDEELEDSSQHSTFLTMPGGEHARKSKELPDYLKNVHLDSSYIKELKTNIIMSFLDHLDEWKENAAHIAEVSKKDKTEELESELDLRLHLHAPRATRIEMDVRNVRAAELVLHRERVNRHCRGIVSALESIKYDFQQMTKKHDEESSEFRQSVDQREDGFVNAAKAAKFAEVTKSLHSDLSIYIQSMKVYLRNFRKNLDATLGKLRESNAQCVRSFKLFCEGGNFSPDETVPLRKRVEKMAQKIDAAEGAVMRDLEGMESRRMEQAVDYVNKFEDRFRNHSTDLGFVEGMQRWLSNSQARIKTEVAFSNGMANEMASHLSTLRRRIDAFEHPNIDKEMQTSSSINSLPQENSGKQRYLDLEHVTSELLHSYTHDVMRSMHLRATYLNCKKILDIPDIQADTTTATLSNLSEGVQDSITPHGSMIEPRPPSSNNRVLTPVLDAGASVPKGGSRVGLDTQGSTVSKGRQPSEDAAIGLIKNILRAQKGKNFGDPDDAMSTITGTSRPPPSASNSVSGRHPRLSYHRQTTLTSIAGSVESESNKKSSADGVVSVVYKRRETKFDPKYMIFGTKPLEGSHFMAKINSILYEALDGMLSSAEIYYKQKSARSVTRPQHIQENFDLCAESVVAKLGKYRLQADDFHNSSLQDFRRLLYDLEFELCHVPRIIINDLLKTEMSILSEGEATEESKFRELEKNWEKEKKAHKHDLRTTLGHPDQDPVLRDLCDRENRRQVHHVDGVKEHAQVLEDNLRECASRFTALLTSKSTQLLKEFDNLLTIDDVNVGRVAPRKELTSVLMRRLADGHDMSVIADPSFGTKPLVERGPNQWPASDLSDFLLKVNDAKGKSPAALKDMIHTVSTTLPHNKIISEREAALSRYRDNHLEAVKRMNNTKSDRLQRESRWQTNWTESVANVKSLYK